MSTTPRITAIAPWFGANRINAARVGAELRGCRWVGVPFAGGMSELAHIDAPSLVVGDLHWHVINLASVVADVRLGPKLYRHLRRWPFHPGVLGGAQRALTAVGALAALADEPDDELRVGLAAQYFVAIWMGRGGKAGTSKELTGELPVRWNGNGGDSNTRYRSAVSSLVAWRRILARCNFVCQDAFEFLGHVKDEPKHGLYVDPPWPDAGAEYKHTFSDDDQRRLAGRLAEFRACRVVIRYGDHPLIRELYPRGRWNWVEVTGRKQSNAEIAEVLIVNGPSRGCA